MSIVRIEEAFQPYKNLLVTEIKDPETLITTNLVITDSLNQLRLLAVEKGLQGESGPQGQQGPVGPAGKDGITFDVLPVESGGTNNSSFVTNKILYYSDNSIRSSDYSVDDLLNNSNAITGIVAESGLYKNSIGNNITNIGVNTGDGLAIDENNKLTIDNTIARKIDLDVGNLSGVLPIFKGGTNYSGPYDTNRLIYFDGITMKSFPVSTGRIVFSGSTINVIAGSGLIGGGATEIPSGNVRLDIVGSDDFTVAENLISLSATGVAGTYTKITTDAKGRVVSGTNISNIDITNSLGYVPWHSGNDGDGSSLDADLLDGQQGDFYLNAQNLTGLINTNVFPDVVVPNTYTKVVVDSHGMVVYGDQNNYFDIIQALGYRPVSTTGDTITGSLSIGGDVEQKAGTTSFFDHLPVLGTNNPYILPSSPRGFKFVYGGSASQTGIFAYYPVTNELKILRNVTGINLTAESSENILLDSTAQTLYVSRLADQTIDGIKIFSGPLFVTNKLTVLSSPTVDPPLDVRGNSRRVIDLNSDLLDGEHGFYYRNAINLTGEFDYTKVIFRNLSGTPARIAVFDTRGLIPGGFYSTTIQDSHIEQNQNYVKVTDNTSLIVGDHTVDYDTSQSFAVGDANILKEQNSAAIGLQNIILGENSVAFNQNNITRSINSIAGGRGAETWSRNQLSIGAFGQLDSDLNQINNGQFSNIALGGSGIIADRSWVSLSPTLTIPKNKTIGYNIEILINKLGGTGSAYFTFNSGILKNSTYFSIDDPYTPRNMTTILKEPIKTEIYNDSQRRPYDFQYRIENIADTTKKQRLIVDYAPLKYSSIETYNVLPFYKYTPNFLSDVSGTYEKTNDGLVVITPEKPRSSGWFIQASGSDRINIRCYNHNMTTGCLASLFFSSGLPYVPYSKEYIVTDIIDTNNFRVKSHEWEGFASNTGLIIVPSSILSVDSNYSFNFIGLVNKNSPYVIYNIDTGLTNRLFRSGMLLDINGLSQNNKIVNVANGSITLENSLYQSSWDDLWQPINVSGNFNQFSRFVFDTSNKIHIDYGGNYGAGPYDKIGKSWTGIYKYASNSSCNLSPTIGITVPAAISGLSGYPVSVRSAVETSGTLTVISKRNPEIRFNYTHFPTFFNNKYECIYTQNESISGISNISIFHKKKEGIDFPSAPFSYSLVCGYGDQDNIKFKIINNKLYTDSVIEDTSNSVYKIKHLNLLYISNIENSIYNLDYDILVSDNYFIRIKTTDRSNRQIEKTFTFSEASFPVSIDKSRSKDNSQYYNGSEYSYDLDDLLLDPFGSIDNLVLNNRLESGVIIGALTTVGGYLPYIDFITATNTFNGVAINNTNILTEPENISFTFPTTQITSNFDSIYRDDDLFFSRPGFLDTATVTGVLYPTAFSGIISGNQILDCNPAPTTFATIGLRIHSDVPYWYKPVSMRLQNDGSYLEVRQTGTNQLYHNRIIGIEGNKIILDIPFTPSGYPYTKEGYGFGLGQDGAWYYPQYTFIYNYLYNIINLEYIHSIQNSIYGLYYDIDIFDGTTPLVFNTISKTFLLDQPYYGNSASGSITYSGIKLENGFNYPDSFYYYIEDIEVARQRFSCANTVSKNTEKGFNFTKNYLTGSGHYFTGLANIYTKPAESVIVIQYAGNNLNIDETKEKSFYLEFINGSTPAEKPISGPYSNYSGYSSDGFYIHNSYFYPNSGLGITGTGYLNLNRNHGLSKNVPSYFINKAPVNFQSAILSKNERTPKDNLFDFDLIKDKILINDNQHYLLNEINKLTYFEQPINGVYATNGFIFSGIISNESTTIYGINPSIIPKLERNMIINSSYFYDGYARIIGTSISNASITIDCIPCIGTNNDGSQKSNNVAMWFNGNIIQVSGLSTPRSYLYVDDQFKILSFNGISSNAFNSIFTKYCRIINQNSISSVFSGISVGGTRTILAKLSSPDINKKENEDRFNAPFGFSASQFLPATGTISLIGSVSGQCSLPVENNIEYHTYGGITETWPRDSEGISVLPPKTGWYTIGVSSETCVSGSLCVTIKGFNGTQFHDWIPDAIDRASVGKNPNFYDENQLAGYMRPWGVNKKLYLDFSDDAPGLNGIYHISDKLDNDTFSINVPYNANYLNRYGLVHIIDSIENIKSHRLPNRNNIFDSIDTNITNANSPIDYSIKSYDLVSKRWKHLVHLNHTVENYGSKEISLNEKPTELIYVDPDKIEINKIEYSINQGLSYIQIDSTTNYNFELPDTINNILFKVTTKNGSGAWKNSKLIDAPKLNIFGLSDYTINTSSISDFDNINKIWVLTINIENINSNFVNNKPITIQATDLSGSVSKTIYYSTKILPKFIVPTITHVSQYENWIVPFAIDQYPGIGSAFSILDNIPGSDYDYSLENFKRPSIVVSGLGIANTGLYQTTVLLNYNDEVVATGIGNIRVWPLDPPITLPDDSTKPPVPDYSLNDNTIGLVDNENIYLNMTSYRQTLNTNSLPSFEFYIKAQDADVEFSNYANLVITYDLSHNNYFIDQDIQYSNKSKRFIIKLTVNSTKNGLFVQPINISIKQPVTRDNNTIWQTFTLTKYINLCIYENIAITNTTVDPLPGDINEVWNFQFDIRKGTSINRLDAPPKIRLSNLPNEGSYLTNPLEYRIEKKFNYNNNLGWWTIFAYAETNNFSEYVTNNQTGIYNISIYAEDEETYSSGNIRLFFNKTKYLDDIKSNIYATPNNSYWTTIDMKNVSLSVNLPDTQIILAETPISLAGSTYIERYDPKINIVENTFIYNPIPDKWDTDLSISNLNSLLDPSTQSNMNVRVKGIAQDKLYAIAKLSFIELTNRPLGLIGRPIMITGDQDFINTPQNPRLYEEGDTWALKFKTIYGLASPFHPPTILLQNTPSQCSGYNPLVEINDTCFSKREWAGDGWRFEFSGVPLCGIAGDRSITVIALDTDNQEKIYLGTDTRPTYISFQALDDSTHPGPRITPLSENDDNNITLFPACNIPIDKAFRFGIRTRDICPIPTGLSGWAVSGQLPSGLDYRIHWPSIVSRPFSSNFQNPTFPYSNLTSGILNIFGTPLTFASGGEYPEKFKFTVFDARGKSNNMLFTFTDGTSPQETSPVDYTMFFANDKPTYSPRSTGTYPSGTGPIVGIPQLGYQPPADIFALSCTSALQNNNCLTSDFTYIQEPSIEYPNRYKIVPAKTSFKLNNQGYNLSPGDEIYIEIYNNSFFNNKYKIQTNNGQYYINIPSFSSVNGSGRFVISKKRNLQLDQYLNRFLYSPSAQTANSISTVPLPPINPKYILGCGKYVYSTSTFDLPPGQAKDFISSMSFVGPNSEFPGVPIVGVEGSDRPFFKIGGQMTPKFKAAVVDYTGVANGGPTEFYIPEGYQPSLSQYDNESYLEIKANGNIVSTGTGLGNYRESTDGTFIRFNAARSPSDIITYTSYGVFDVNDIELKKLQIQTVYPDEQDNGIYSIQTNSCRETGYFRISGIAIPQPYAFVPSPLPAQGADSQSAPFTYNNQAGNDFETQVAYGNSPVARLKRINQRNTALSYILYDTVLLNSNNIRASGRIQSSFNGSTTSVSVFTNINSNPSGSIFHLHIFYPGDIFPTYGQHTVSGPFPPFENHYYWINKAGPRVSAPQQNFFPPIIPTGLSFGAQQDVTNIRCIGDLPIPSYSGIAIGGYIPVPDAEPDFWNTSTHPVSNYPPYMTGIVQSGPFNKPSIITNYFHSGVQQNNPSPQNQYMLVGINNSFNNPISQYYGLASGHVIEILYNNSSMSGSIYNLTTNIEEFNSLPILPSNTRTTGLLINDPTTNIDYIRIKYTGINIPISGYATINNKIEIIEKNNSTITFSHNNINLSVNDFIDVEQRDISTSVNVSPNDKFDVLITQKTNSTIVGKIVERDNPLADPSPSNLDTGTFDNLIVNDFCNIYKNISYSIKPINISLQGYLWNFSLSGIVNFNGEYDYKMITMENTSSPVMTGNFNLTPKKFFNRFRINASLGISITSSNLLVDPLTGNWRVILFVSGGSLPLSKHTPEVRVNDSLCGFYRVLDSNMNDYIQNNQRIIILYNDKYNTTATVAALKIEISDSTGSVTRCIDLSTGLTINCSGLI